MGGSEQRAEKRERNSEGNREGNSEGNREGNSERGTAYEKWGVKRAIEKREETVREPSPRSEREREDCVSSNEGKDTERLRGSGSGMARHLAGCRSCRPSLPVKQINRNKSA